MLHSSSLSNQLLKKCFAKDKLRLFLEGNSTFSIGHSAFSQCNSKLLAEFLNENKENYELVAYFLYISEPLDAKNIIESFPTFVLAEMFRNDFKQYEDVKRSIPREKREKNFFKVKSYRYWQYLHYQTICDIIVFLVRTKGDAELASQFLMILPSQIISTIRDFTGFLPEEEKSLYKALGDAIYELPIQSPKIYKHIVSLFEDDMEIFIVLSTMEELVKRQEQILDLTESLLNYTEKRTIDLDIQYIFSELNGYDLLIALEVLGQLQERQKITGSQKDTLIQLLETGSLDVLKNMKRNFKL